MIIWHYAVWKGSYPHMWPACIRVGWYFTQLEPKHGMTINRGDVNCSACLRMMGS